MNFKTKEKGNIALLMIIVLVIIGASGYLFYRYRSSDALVADLSKRFFGNTTSSKTATPSSATAPKKAISSSIPNIYYYRGKVLKIEEDKKLYRYSVTFQSQDENGKSSGNITTFTIPIYPPATNSSILGKDFKQMIDKGCNPIYIKISYDEKQRFVSWESLTPVSK